MKIYQIKITLKGIEPPIWRRIEVPADIKLGKLHRVLQDVIGWTNSHLHAFRIGRETYGVPDPEFPEDLISERNIRLDSVVEAGDTIVYEYDFGDGWEHALEIEKAIVATPGVRYPRCTAGKRACPPEDCGGPPGYERLLEILRDPEHEEHDEMREWLSADFDSEAFELERTNQLVSEIK